MQCEEKCTVSGGSPGFYLLEGRGEASPQKVLLKKNLQLFQIKIFLTTTLRNQ